MLCELVTPDASVYKGDAFYVRVPGSKGSFGILNNHAPIISTLEPGVIKIVQEDDSEIQFDIPLGGLVEVKNNHVVILGESMSKVS